MRALAPVITLGILCGCATPSDMRKDEPLLSASSAKPAKSVAICIIDGWQNGGPMGNGAPVTMRESETGYVVMRTNNMTGQIVLLADVDSTKSGSATALRAGVVPGWNYYRDVVTKCQI